MAPSRQKLSLRENPASKGKTWCEKCRSIFNGCDINQFIAGFKIDEKSVSRQHLTIKVSKVTPGDGVGKPSASISSHADRRLQSRVHTSSEITFTDLGTKFGSVIDGDRITDATRVLKGNAEHLFVLGNTKHTFW